MDDTAKEPQKEDETQVEDSNNTTADLVQIGVSSSTQPQSQAELVISLTNLINSNLSEIKNIEEQISQNKEMVKSVLANDSLYVKHADAAKESSRIKGNTKKEIFKRPDVIHIVEKLTELKSNLSDTKDELSNYIQEYQASSGQNYFESEDGTIQEIVYIAKLRKKAA